MTLKQYKDLDMIEGNRNLQGSFVEGEGDTPAILKDGRVHNYAVQLEEKQMVGRAGQLIGLVHTILDDLPEDD